MKHSRLFTVIALAALVAACQPKGEAKDPAAEAAKKPVATINGKAITQGEFDTFVKQVAGRAVADLDAEQKKRALDSLIGLHVLGACLVWLATLFIPPALRTRGVTAPA